MAGADAPGFSSDGGFVQVAGEFVPVDEAYTIVAGYCLGEDPMGWRVVRDGVGEELGEMMRPAFAYRVYDCVPGRTDAAAGAHRRARG
jgi:hypothetical protein